jgi:hypothetical protein
MFGWTSSQEQGVTGAAGQVHFPHVFWQKPFGAMVGLPCVIQLSEHWPHAACGAVQFDHQVGGQVTGKEVGLAA